jgi:hypothetical protein
VASNEVYSVRAIARALGRALDAPVAFEPAARPRAFDLIADTTLLQRLLAPRFERFEDAVREIVSATPGTAG